MAKATLDLIERTREILKAREQEKSRKYKIKFKRQTKHYICQQCVSLPNNKINIRVRRIFENLFHIFYLNYKTTIYFNPSIQQFPSSICESYHL